MSLGELFQRKFDDKSALIDQALADQGIDEITKQELVAKAATSASTAELKALYDEALTGKGIYGKRLKNEQLARSMTDIPGQKQLFLSNQQRVAAGQATLGFGVAQSGPLLTGPQQQQNINPMSPTVIKR